MRKDAAAAAVGRRLASSWLHGIDSASGEFAGIWNGWLADLNLKNKRKGHPPTKCVRRWSRKSARNVCTSNGSVSLEPGDQNEMLLNKQLGGSEGIEGTEIGIVQLICRRRGN